MAITDISSGLTSFNPVYNPLVYMFDSTNKNESGFRYVVDIYSAGTSTKIYEGRVAPRVGDGYGYIDVSKIISNHITYDLDITGITSIHAVDSRYIYDVKVGEEYKVVWEFEDIVFAGLPQLSGSTSGPVNGYSAGTQIIVTHESTLYPAIKGLQTVFAIVDAYNFTINIPFESTPTGTSGTTTLASGAKTIFRDLLIYSADMAYNSAFSSSDWIDYDSNDYELGNATSTTDKMLTNIPDNFKCSSTQDLFVNSNLDNVTGLTSFVFSNDSGDILFKSSVSNYDINQTAVGPNNLGALTLRTGTSPLIKADTKYYDFHIEETSAATITKSYRVYIDDKCGIEDYEILFLDRKGSWSSFRFPLRAETNIKGKRTTFNEQIGDLKAGKWAYDRTDNGLVTSNVSISEDIKLRTDYITGEMSIYFQELVFSPVTYVKIDGVYFSCVVQTKSYKPQSPKNNKLIKEEVVIVLSNQNNINI